MSQFPPRAFIRMAAKLDVTEKEQPESRTGSRRCGGELRFLSLRDVLDRLTISRSLLYELIKDPVQPFPPPIHIGRRSVWEASEVEAYMQLILEEARGKGSAAQGR
jgi:predicted DNA-binding transcriptional regulator AlpA